MRETLQTATTIAKTTQTQMGNTVRCGGFDFLALYFDYVNGDETGVIVTAWVSIEFEGTFIQHQYIEPEVFAPKTDLEMTVEMTAAGASAAAIVAGLDIVLVAD